MHSSDARLARVLMDMNLVDVGPLEGSHQSQRPVARAKPSWLPWRGYRVLGQLGAWLVTLGKRLEQYTLVQPAP